jgi:hypothetical protein
VLFLLVFFRSFVLPSTRNVYSTIYICHFGGTSVGDLLVNR